jgi:uncharacterized membrane protein YdfJ with MMPL/SSD domain
MLKRYSWLALIFTLVAALAIGITGMAQDDDGAEEAPATEAAEETAEEASEETAEETAETSSLEWEEAIFVLMVIAIVMGGLVGFEYIQRRRHTIS